MRSAMWQALPFKNKFWLVAVIAATTMFFASGCGKGMSSQFTPSKEFINQLKPMLNDSKRDPNVAFDVIDVKVMRIEKRTRDVTVEVTTVRFGVDEKITVAGRLDVNGRGFLQETEPGVCGLRITGSMYCGDDAIGETCDKSIVNIWFRVAGNDRMRQFVSEALKKSVGATAAETHATPDAKSNDDDVMEGDGDGIDDQVVEHTDPDATLTAGEGLYEGTPRDEYAAKYLIDYSENRNEESKQPTKCYAKQVAPKRPSDKGGGTQKRKMLPRKEKAKSELTKPRSSPAPSGKAKTTPSLKKPGTKPDEAQSPGQQSEEPRSDAPPADNSPVVDDETDDESAGDDSQSVPPSDASPEIPDEEPEALPDAADAPRSDRRETPRSDAPTGVPADAPSPKSSASRPTRTVEEVESRWAELEQRSAPIIDLRKGAQAVGCYGISRQAGCGNGGAIRGVTELAQRDQGFARYAGPESAFGTGMMISLLRNSAKSMQRVFPTLIMSYGSIARQGGGRFAPHASHQNGLDADILYPRAPSGSVVNTSRGQVTKDFHPEEFWAYVSLIHKQKMIKQNRYVTVLDRVFVHPAVKRAICSWSKSRGLTANPEAAEILKRIVATRQTRSNGRAFINHHDHFHVRLKCSPYYPLCISPTQDPQEGC